MKRLFVLVSFTVVVVLGWGSVPAGAATPAIQGCYGDGISALASTSSRSRRVRCCGTRLRPGPELAPRSRGRCPGGPGRSGPGRHRAEHLQRPLKRLQAGESGTAGDISVGSPAWNGGPSRTAIHPRDSALGRFECRSPTFSDSIPRSTHHRHRPRAADAIRPDTARMWSRSSPCSVCVDRCHEGTDRRIGAVGPRFDADRSSTVCGLF